MSRKLLKEMTYVKMASLPLYICSLLLCSIFGAGQALGSQVTLTATEDAYVSELTHTGNYGNTSNLFIGWVNDTSYAYETYLKFGLSSIPSGSIINSATLRLYCTDVGWDRWVYGNVHYVMGSWAESTITWDNKPSYGSANESEEYNTTGWWEWDVQDFVGTFRLMFKRSLSTKMLLRMWMRPSSKASCWNQQRIVSWVREEAGTVIPMLTTAQKAS